MIEYEKFNKVIKGLEHELQNRGKCGHYCRDGQETVSCEYDKDGLCIQHWGKDAIALLKAQEPMVMTWDELIATDHVYIETNKDGQKYIVHGIVTIVRDTTVFVSVRIGTRLIDCMIDKDDYGKHFRCWTSRPTDAQMKAVKWE